MTTTAEPMIGASPPEVHWDAIDWQTIERQVLRLQMRIAKATREGRWGKVNALQWLLTLSTVAQYVQMTVPCAKIGGNAIGPL
jgi:RNA-directed DNA polymerase